MIRIVRNPSVVILLTGLLSVGCAHHRAVESCGENGCGSCPMTAVSEDGVSQDHVSLDDFSGDEGTPLPREQSDAPGTAPTAETFQHVSRTASRTNGPTADHSEQR